MLARTDRPADPIRVPVYRKLPSLVRISSLVAILLDPRAYFGICGFRSHEISAFTVPTRRPSCFEHRGMSRSALRLFRPPCMR